MVECWIFMWNAPKHENLGLEWELKTYSLSFILAPKQHQKTLEDFHKKMYKKWEAQKSEGVIEAFTYKMAYSCEWS